MSLSRDPWGFVLSLQKVMRVILKVYCLVFYSFTRGFHTYPCWTFVARYAHSETMDPDIFPITWWQRPIIWCWHLFLTVDLWLADRARRRKPPPDQQREVNERPS